jgi:uncharacterized protein
MECPVCKTVNLVMSERQGIEIDYCPQCRGIWLDRGELDKIIDRTAAQPGAARTDAPARPSQGYGEQGHYDPRHGGGHYPKKKREGFLADLFDFD